MKKKAAQKVTIAERFEDYVTKIDQTSLTIGAAQSAQKRAMQQRRRIAAVHTAQDAEEFASKLKQSAAERAAITQKVTDAREAATAERKRLADKQLEREAAAGQINQIAQAPHEASVVGIDLSQPQAENPSSATTAVYPGTNDSEEAERAPTKTEPTIDNKDTDRFKRFMCTSAAVTAVIVVAAVGTMLAIKNHRAILESGKNILQKCTNFGKNAVVQKATA